MADIIPFSGTGLALQNIGKYRAAIQQVKAEAPVIGGTPILRLDKEGIWRYGQELTEVQEGSLWAANPLSFQIGYICWRTGVNKPLGKQMRNVFSENPRINEGELPDVGGQWSQSVAFDLVCMNGDDKGTMVQFTANTMGGVERWHVLLDELDQQLGKDPTCPMAIISLEHDGYFHTDAQRGTRHPETKQPGWIVKPIFRVVEWRSLDGTKVSPLGEASPAEPVAAPAAAAPEAAKPATRRRRAATTA